MVGLSYDECLLGSTGCPFPPLLLVLAVVLGLVLAQMLALVLELVLNRLQRSVLSVRAVLPQPGTVVVVYCMLLEQLQFASSALGTP
jgi:hypothetical protein